MLRINLIYNVKDIEYGVDTVQALLKQGKVFIAPHCKNVIYEFETYRYRDKRPGVDISEKPVKENDHSMDAIRYTLTTYVPVMESLEDREDFDMYGADYE